MQNQESTSRIFDPERYRLQYYTTPEGHSQQKMDAMPQIWTNQAFDIIPECQSCLQIGCGPVLTFAASASRKCKNIYLSQFNTQCFKSIAEQLTRDQSQKSFWKPHYQYIGKLQGRDHNQIAKRLRNRIISCFKCDLTQDQIIGLNYFKKVDVIVSSLCIEAVAKDLIQYQNMIKKIKNYLKKDGFLFLFGVLQQTFYKVKDQKLPCIQLTQNDVKNALQINGFQVIKLNSQRHQDPPSQTSDFKGLFSVLAKNTK